LLGNVRSATQGQQELNPAYNKERRGWETVGRGLRRTKVIGENWDDNHEIYGELTEKE
jgi:hypothetical protein